MVVVETAAFEAARAARVAAPLRAALSAIEAMRDSAQAAATAPARILENSLMIVTRWEAGGLTP
eukprot:SAG31_NODE_783_length_12123_cov_5.272130_2_plen_64_part_00